MKGILAVALIAGFSFCAQCFDLTLNNGHVYKNVEVTSTVPDGFDIISHNDMGLTVARHIHYSELTANSLKHFPNYDKAKAEAYVAKEKASHEKAVAKNKALYAQWTENGAADKPIVYPVSNVSSMRVVFKATKDLDNGTIGWASTEDYEEPVSHFGKIYIHGLKITAGNEWVGNVYMTNTFMTDKRETCPCYATSKDIAERIEKRGL